MRDMRPKAAPPSDDDEDAVDAGSLKLPGPAADADAEDVATVVAEPGAAMGVLHSAPTGGSGSGDVVEDDANAGLVAVIDADSPSVHSSLGGVRPTPSPRGALGGATADDRGPFASYARRLRLEFLDHPLGGRSMGLEEEDAPPLESPAPPVPTPPEIEKTDGTDEELGQGQGPAATG